MSSARAGAARAQPARKTAADPTSAALLSTEAMPAPSAIPAPIESSPQPAAETAAMAPPAGRAALPSAEPLQELRTLLSEPEQAAIQRLQERLDDPAIRAAE